MHFPRITAVLLLLLLIGGLSLVCIDTLNLLAPPHAYGSHVEHVEGIIIQMGVNKSGMDFVLETANGQHMHFQCDNPCRASQWHVERHLLEHANTDVYYVEKPGNSLLAVDVD
ncbi:MAG TPA: hypothetical protein VNG51_20265 [Ktedonobacteraceae bacterium]|nr:hypothetical protein [Ktedonobacteraceae bacterium]